MKPAFEIDISVGAQSALPAHGFLELVELSRTFHTKRNLRPPLGIYNVSVARVLHKVTTLCSKLEPYVQSFGPRDTKPDIGQTMNEDVIDYIELTLYAASEHIDDLKLIVDNFYPTDVESRKCKAHKKFNEDIKVLKSFIAKLTNHIKHAQHRIRLYGIGFTHGGSSGTLHGYFVESAEGGVVGPSSVFHAHGSNVFSITSLAWEVLCFLLQSSASLKIFLESKPLLNGPAKTSSEAFQKAVIAAARLPLYTFDDPHPFEKCTLKLAGDETSSVAMSSGIYGSIFNRWRDDPYPEFGSSAVAFSGDGVSRSFRIVSPSKVGLQHWQPPA
jgi:hypothetical protein